MSPLILAAAVAWSGLPERRVAIVVGTNAAPAGREPLRFAHRDAQQVAETLIEVGGWRREDVRVLLEPSPAAMLDALAHVGEADLVLLYYSGHGDDGRLYPGGHPLEMSTVQEHLEATGAALRLGVLDACRGGGWTGSKGLVPTTSFELPLARDSSGTVYVAASSGREDAHEAEVLEGSFFTHHWTQGLRGAADTSADGLVTLEESFDYARAQTIRDSTILADQAQHPSFHIDLRGRSPLVLADLRSAPTVLDLSFDRGTVSVHAVASGVRVAELEHRREGYRLGLVPGEYLLRRRQGARVEIARVQLVRGEDLRVAEDDFEAPSSTLLGRKGGSVGAFDRMGPARGEWIGQLAGLSHLDPAVATDLQVGLTDRVSLNLPAPSVGLRLGRRDGVEAMLVGGLLGLDLMGLVEPTLRVDNQRVWHVDGTPGAAVQLRAPIGERAALLAKVALGQELSMVWPPSVTQVGRATNVADLAAGIGFGVAVSDTIVLYPGVAVPYQRHFQPSLVVGSVLDRSSRRLPLVQIRVTDDVAIDGHLQVACALRALQLELGVVGIGVTAALSDPR